MSHREELRLGSAIGDIRDSAAGINAMIGRLNGLLDRVDAILSQGVTFELGPGPSVTIRPRQTPQAVRQRGRRKR